MVAPDRELKVRHSGHLYGAFIGDPTHYVLNQLIETVLAKDKDFRTWMTARPGPYAPAPGTSSRQRSINHPGMPYGATIPRRISCMRRFAGRSTDSRRGH